VTRYDRTDSSATLAARQRIVDGLDVTARYTEHVLDPRFFEARDDQLCHLDLDQLVSRHDGMDVILRSNKQ
jgi:hypothetical protein